MISLFQAKKDLEKQLATQVKANEESQTLIKQLQTELASIKEEKPKTEDASSTVAKTEYEKIQTEKVELENTIKMIESELATEKQNTKDFNNKVAMASMEKLATAGSPMVKIDTDNTPTVLGVTAFLEGLESKANTSERREYIREHPDTWKELLIQRENTLKGRT